MTANDIQDVRLDVNIVRDVRFRLLGVADVLKKDRLVISHEELGRLLEKYSALLATAQNYNPEE